jgi:hypothetical protein
MTTHTEPIDTIYRLAVVYSRETRGQVVADLDGLNLDAPERWRELVNQRSKDGSSRTLRAAGRSLVKLASDPAKPYVRRAVKKLLDAVKDLAEFRPDFAEQEQVVPAAVARRLSLGRGAVAVATRRPTAASVARLDELRNGVRVALIHLDELFERYDTPAARFLAVARRVASVVLEPTAAKLVAGWLERLERGDSAAA